MLAVIKQEIEKQLQKFDSQDKGWSLVIPPDSSWGDLSCPCFDPAKIRQVNPVALAKEVADFWQKNIKESWVEKVVAVGPYVNFFLSAPYLAGQVVPRVLTDKHFGQNRQGKKKRIMVEYPSQNTHKEFHIGHLRNICIGNALVNLFQANGFQVVPVNYINDFGRHVAKCLWGIQKFYPQFTPRTEQQKWLGQVYAEASQYLADHEDANQEVDEWQARLEAREPRTMKLFRQTRAWSLQGFTQILRELKTKHRRVFYESEVKDRGQQIVDELLQKGLAKIGEKGAIIIDLQAFGLDIALLRKSTGAGLYLTSDLSLAEKKFKKYKVAESINITGSEQNFYFKQLFKILELNGFKHKMTHIGYGLVNRPEGKMSSRLGNVILYADLRQQIFEHLAGETTKRHPDWSTTKVNQTARIMTLAVLKFTMQKHEASKVITFDFEEAVSFDGYSAPYILYALARINSLRRKSQIRGRRADFTCLVEPSEKQLILLLAQYPEIVEKAFADYNPSVIAKYCFDLSQAFNDWYNQCSILQAGNPVLIKARLALAWAVKLNLERALGILTIEAVEEM